jgi:hypothetical protein
MIDQEEARLRLPAHWRRVDLKKLLGNEKARARELIDNWLAAGQIEPVPDAPHLYRFTGLAAATDTPDTNPPPVAALQDADVPEPDLPEPDSPKLDTPYADDVPAARRSRRPALLQPTLGELPSLGDLPARLSALAGQIALPRTQRIWLLGGALALVLVALVSVLTLSPGAAPASEEPTPVVENIPALQRPVVAWYAPGHTGQAFGVVPAETPYEPVARYGNEWVQLELEQTGLLWVRLNDVPEVATLLINLPDLMPAEEAGVPETPPVVTPAGSLGDRPDQMP